MIDSGIILNVMIGAFLYEVVLKAIGSVILDRLFKEERKEGKDKVKKSFKERMQEIEKEK